MSAEPSTDHLPCIETVLTDGSHHLLPPRVLHVMLDLNYVKHFKRSSGWVTVGVDPVRVKYSSTGGNEHQGPERRTPLLV